MNIQVCMSALVLCAGAACAQVDGMLDGSYGAALSVQSQGTQFGNSNLGQIGFANGSELNAAYGHISGGNLHLMLTGNLESNFNKLELFIANGGAGQNTLRGDNPNVDFNGLNRMAGLTFDAGFEATHWISVTGGNPGTGQYTMFANAAFLLPGGGGAGGFLGQIPAGPNGGLTGGTNFPGLQVAVDNSNTAGVTDYSGGFDPAALSAIKGIEMVIPLAFLGIDGSSPIKLCAFINGGGHDFVSNQVLGALPAGTGNLGEPSAVNFNNFAGEQCFTVIPSPGVLAGLGMGLVGFTRRRRG